MSLFLVAGRAQPAQGQEDAVIESVRKGAEAAATAFNAGKVDDLAAMFLPEGEFIDEEGVVYQGQQEIKGLFSAFFEKFPESKLAVDVESIRLTGPVAIEEGTRTITTKDGATRSQFRYIAVRVKSDSGWKIASFRDFSDDPVPTPHEYLQPLAGLVGDWINEGADGKVAISYRWSEDQELPARRIPGHFARQPNDHVVAADRVGSTSRKSSAPGCSILMAGSPMASGRSSRTAL